MRTKLRLLLLAMLLLALDTAARDVTEDAQFLQRNGSENNINTTEFYRQLELNSGDDDWTAGRTLCRPGNKCGFHQYSSYKYCYVDYSDNWDYCCTGPCGYDDKKYMWCQSGSEWQYCGNGGLITIDGIPCYYTHQCGMHMDDVKEDFYWCYIDHKLSWSKCCAPSSECHYDEEGLKWCYTGFKINTDWQPCE